MTTQTGCAACESGSLVPVGEVPGYVEGLDYAIGECDFCGSQTPLTNHPIPEGLYESIYLNAARLHGYSRYVSYAHVVERSRYPLYFLATKEPAYWAVRSILHERRRAGRGTRVLEVGSGLGYTTAALRKFGYDATGVDVSSRATSEATRRFGAWYRTGDARDPETFGEAYDVVVGLELIEHLESPSEFVTQLLALLAPDGELVISTPNRDQYRSDNVWATDLPPVHLHWFSEQGMLSLCPTGAQSELFDFTAYNRRFGKRFGLKTRLGPSRPFLDESLSLTDPIQEATLLTWSERFRHHPATYLLAVGAHRTKDAARAFRDFYWPEKRRPDVDQRRTPTIVTRYSIIS